MEDKNSIHSEHMPSTGGERGNDPEKHCTAETKLKESEEQFRSLYTAMNEGVCLNEIVFDKSGLAVDYRILDFNPSFGKMTGLDKEKAVGQLASRLLGATSPSHLALYARVAETGKPVSFEDFFPKMNKHFSISVFRPKKGMFATLYFDISAGKAVEADKKELERQLRQTQKLEAIGTLAGGIAHDFNNILFPILGFAEMLQEDIPKDSPLQEGIREILIGTKRSRELVQQILAFSRQAEKEPRPLKIQTLLKEVLKLVRSTLPSTIAVSQRIDGHCGTVYADPTEIHQVVMNLITNAFHAMEDMGGKLTICLKEISSPLQNNFGPLPTETKCACLSVEDTGCGMDENTLEKIFNPYFTTKDKEKGTGLGLSVVHGIVKSYHGEIKVQSKPGAGTRFDIYLPIHASEPEFQLESVPTPLPEGHERILLVDDEEQILKLGGKILSRLGYEVDIKISSVEALNAFRTDPEKFDLVITDMTMPGLTGDRLSVEILKIRSEIPIILCTGFSEKISEQRAKALGLKGFLMKPIIRSELANMVRKVLDE